MIKITQAAETVEEDYHGVTLIIARTNNNEYRAKFRRLSKPFSHQLEKRTLSAAKETELICSAMACTVLVGWRGVFPDGKEYEFNEANAKDLLINDVDCRERVSMVGGDLSMYMEDEEAETVKKP